jgi:hypothetical protein
VPCRLSPQFLRAALLRSLRPVGGRHAAHLLSLIFGLCTLGKVVMGVYH